MVASWTSLATAGLLALTAPEPSQAEIDGTRWSKMQSEPERGPGPRVLDRQLRLKRVPGGLEVTGRWRLATTRPAWFADVLVTGSHVHVREARLGGKPARILATAGGVLVVERITRDTVLELEAFIPGSSDVELGLLGAPRGVVELEDLDDGMHVVDLEDRPVLRRGETFVTGTGRLRLEPRTPQADDAGGTLSVAHVGIGLTVGDGAVAGRGHVRVDVRRGRMETLRLAVEHVGSDLQLEGPNVAEWNRDGGWVDVNLRQPADDRVDLELSWTSAVSKAAESTLATPKIEPSGVFRTESALQLARDGEVDVIPQMQDWTTIAAAQLPAWGRGLVRGAPTAAFQRPGAARGGTLALVRYVAVPTPPMVVDVADVRVATSREGRFVMRARYEIFNERSAHLVFRPPPGARLTGVTVAGQPVRPARDGDAYRIPLPRSVETLEGPSIVPVVVGLRGEGASWGRHARGELPLPTVEAPIAVLRATHVLPPRYANALEPGDGAVVEGFTRGDQVAYGLDDDQLASQADQLYADALEAWNSNEFEDARGKLGQLEDFGARNDSTRGLSSNVDLVLGPTDTPAPAPASGEFVLDGANITPEAPEPGAASVTSTSVRRIKAQVRARAAKQRNRFRDRKKKAKDLQESGRYEEAEEEYEKALEDAKKLDRLEDEESRSYDFEADEIEGELETTREQKASRDALEQAEYDMLSGGYPLFAGPDDEPDVAPAPLPPPVVPIVIPRAGQMVRHEFPLLEPGAQRRIRFDARRSTERRRR